MIYWGFLASQDYTAIISAHQFYIHVFSAIRQPARANWWKSDRETYDRLDMKFSIHLILYVQFFLKSQDKIPDLSVPILRCIRKKNIIVVKPLNNRESSMLKREYVNKVYSAN